MHTSCFRFFVKGLLWLARNQAVALYACSALLEAGIDKLRTLLPVGLASKH